MWRCNSVTINQRLFDLIAKKGVSNAEFCKQTGIPPTTLSAWKTRGTNPPADDILRICNYFAVSPEFLLSGVDTPVKISNNQKDILELWDKLDDQGRTVVKAEAIRELRRLEK